MMGYLFRTNGGKCRLEFSQQEGRHDYVNWRTSVISGFADCSEPKLKRQTHSSNGIWRVHTHVHPVFTEMYPHFYSESRKRRLSDYAISLIDELALAVWYLDDGTYSKSRQNDFCNIASNSYSVEENRRLSFHLMQRFRLEARVNGPENSPFLQFTKSSSALLREVVIKHFGSLLSTMHHKMFR